MTADQLAAIARRLALPVLSARPLGGVLYVPVTEYQEILKAAQALYAEVTAPVPAPKPKA